jgi:hypothetical protein
MNEQLSELWDLLEEAIECSDAISYEDTGDSPSLTLRERISSQIWTLFDEILETLPVEQHLFIAAKVFSAIAVRLDKRSQQLLKDWSDSTSPVKVT